MATNPMILDAETLKRLQPPAPPALAPMPGVSAIPSMPAPTLPTITKIQDPATQSTGLRLISDQNELKRLGDTGDGISQIKQPFLRGLARTGNVIESILAPRAAAFTPGTSENHQRLLNQETGRVNNDLDNQKEQAQIGQENALTDYTLQRPDIEQSKIDQKQTAVQERVGQLAAARGQTVSWGADGLPVFQDDHSSQAFADHQALSAMHQATAEKSTIMADIAKNHYIPGTPEFTEAQRKLDAVDKRLNVAVASLGLRAQGLQLRQNDQNANFYGMGPDGKALPNAPQFTNEEGEVTTGGLKGAGLATKQQGKVATFNDLTGSVGHLRNAIKAYEAEGGDMSDARLAQAATDPHSVIGKVINGKLITGGLSPAAISLLNAQRQTMEQAGILRSTTGGTASEAGAQRILAVVPQFGSDTNKSAYSKLDEQNEVLKRLAPGQTAVAGGVKVHRAETGHTQAGGTYKQTATGSNGHKIGSNDGGNTWFDTQTGKAIQ